MAWKVPAFFSTPRKIIVLPLVFAYLDLGVFAFFPEVFSDPLRWAPLAAMNLLAGADMAIRRSSDSERRAGRAVMVALFILFPAIVALPHFEAGLPSAASPGTAFRVVAFALEIAGGVLLLLARAKLGKLGSTDIAIEEGHRLVTDGLYSRIRNPMYLGALLLHPGYCAASGGPISAVAAFALLFVVFAQRARLEENMLEGEFGEEYRAYLRRTGRFLPSPFRASASRAGADRSDVAPGAPGPLSSTNHREETMATITFKGNPVHTSGNLPAVGAKAPDFRLTTGSLSEVGLADFAGKVKIVNIVPSLDTGVCAASARAFNKAADGLGGVVVLTVSRDLPFAQKRFCEAEGIKAVVPLSELRDRKFGAAWGAEMTDGPLAGLLSRAVVVLDKADKVVYVEQVPEIAQEPAYAAALEAAKKAL